MYTVVLLYIRGRYHYFIVNDLYRKPTDTSLWRVSHNKDLLLLLLFTHVYHSIIVHCMPLYILFTMFTLSLYRCLLCITLLKARFVNVLKNIDKQRTIQSTLTLQQQFLRTSINPATRSQTQLIPFELQPTLSMSRGEAS